MHSEVFLRAAEENGGEVQRGARTGIIRSSQFAVQFATLCLLSLIFDNFCWLFELCYQAIK